MEKSWKRELVCSAFLSLKTYESRLLASPFLPLLLLRVLIMFVYRSFAAIEMNKQPISHKLFAKRQWYEMRWDGVKSSSNCLTFAPDVWFILIFSHIYLYTVTDLGSRNPPTNQHTDSCLFHSLFYSWANIENSTDIILCSIQRPKTFHRYVFLLIERERNR